MTEVTDSCDSSEFGYGLGPSIVGDFTNYEICKLGESSKGSNRKRWKWRRDLRYRIAILLAEGKTANFICRALDIKRSNLGYYIKLLLADRIVALIEDSWPRQYRQGPHYTKLMKEYDYYKYLIANGRGVQGDNLQIPQARVHYNGGNPIVFKGVRPGDLEYYYRGGDKNDKVALLKHKSRSVRNDSYIDEWWVGSMTIPEDILGYGGGVATLTLNCHKKTNDLAEQNELKISLPHALQTSDEIEQEVDPFPAMINWVTKELTKHAGWDIRSRYDVTRGLHFGIAADLVEELCPGLLAGTTIQPYWWEDNSHDCHEVETENRKVAIDCLKMLEAAQRYNML